MNQAFVKRLAAEIEEIKNSGLYKTERIITSPQGAEITVNGKQYSIFAPITTWVFLLTQK